MILVNNTLVQGQHDFYKRAGITLSEKINEKQNPVLNPENPGAESTLEEEEKEEKTKK